MSFRQDASAAGGEMDVAATAGPRHVLADVDASQVKSFVGAHRFAGGFRRVVLVTVHAS